MATPSPIDLSVREPASRLLDEPFVLRARTDVREPLIWRGRYRDDDGRVWKSAGASPAELALGWEPAKPRTEPVATLDSLRPVRIDVRVEAADGRAAGRQLTRRLLSDGVRPRRWRDGLVATLYLPADPVGSAVVVRGPALAAAAALLASRGVLTLALADGDVGVAVERLAAVPSAPPELLTADVVVPPNVGVAGEDAAGARVAAWDALLERLGARPRVSP